MYQYAIGLDIGISSVGWAAIALDEAEQPCGIINMGSRIFDAAENPKTGASLAAPRREARSARRRLRRHRHRNARIQQLLISSAVITQEELNDLFDGRLEDIYALRVRALDEPVTNLEMTRILIHIAQRRGFRSNRKAATSKEDGELLHCVSENQLRMTKNGYRTVAEMFLRDDAYRESKRNKGGGYIATVSRDMVENEVRQIFGAQRSFGMPFASEELEEAYLTILLSQRSFDEGPGGNSPYGGNQIEKMVGKCTFEPDQARAAKATYSFEYFNLLEKINHIQIVENGQGIPLTGEQREQLIALAHKQKKVTYANIRKTLQIPETCTFNMVHYASFNGTHEEAEKKEELSCLKAYHQMRSAFEKAVKGSFAQVCVEHRNAIGRVLSLYKTEEKIRKELAESGLSPWEIDAATTIGSFSKFGHLSEKACSKLIPFLEQGMKYNDACTAAGYQFKGHSEGERSRLLHITQDDLADLTSPVVCRAVSQSVKVINAIIRDRGCSPMFINIELAREMSRNLTDRNKMKKSMEDNRKKNERIMERLRTEFGRNDPTGQDLLKLKLYEEQSGICMYSQKPLSIQHLFDPNYAEIDHIIPYSISFDDSFRNKVLVLAKENRDKGNRLPLQYLDGKRKEDFVVWVNSSVRDYKKRQKLLKESFSEEDRKQFKQRNLEDTQTMATFLMNFIRDNLQFAESKTGRKKRVTAVSGAVTSYMRKRWGITKLRENGDLHHAVDALVIGCTTDGMIQQVSRYAAYRECRYQQDGGISYAIDPETGEVIQQFPHPWPLFHQELEARLSSNPAVSIDNLKIPFYYHNDIPVKPVFVSRAPRHKVTGPAHKETIKSPKAKEAGLLVTKTPLTKLKLKDGEIKDYYEHAKVSDALLYQALKDRLVQFGGDAAKAFAEPFYKPKKDGTPGPRVTSVKLSELSTLNTPVLQEKGMANNGDMVRIDVFYVENDGYYFVPIYVADTLKPQLPNKACVANKTYDLWKEMREEDFVFSLYPNDLVRVTHKKGFKLSICNKASTLDAQYETKESMLYYICANISTGALTLETHDGAYCIKSMGLKTLERVEKYTVDVLGNYHWVEKEKRQAFYRKRG